jgi:glyoxylase-like metal-dependent hydrolase (beta-lactamase superfamily II)
MFLDMVERVFPGEENGNNKIFRLKLPSGREIIGLATENKYGGDWDLGPTWNYVVGPENPFLVDTGKSGMGHKLLEMMARLGIKGKDLDFVLISHGHEDHDGGLGELVGATGIPVKAHPIYERLRCNYPDKAPFPSKEKFSASCWHCFMPDSFTQVHCLKYHQERNELEIEGITDSLSPNNPDIKVHHLPGHSPDSIALQIGKEALIVGDILLPEITPLPTQEKFNQFTETILSIPESDGQLIYGLRAYLRSLKGLREIAQQCPQILVLPGHRLFNKNQWNILDLNNRVNEMIEHHVQRCGAIVTILKKGPQTAEEVAKEHFDSKLLKGFGINMAVNEILSHAELLRFSGDVVMNADGRFVALGTCHFESLIRNQPVAGHFLSP